MKRHRKPSATAAPPTESEALRAVTRRHFFRQCGVGLGSIALGGLFGLECGSLARAEESAPEPSRDPLAPRPGHFPARAKNVIFLFMAGGPSQLELFEHKPELRKFDGTLVPESYM